MRGAATLAVTLLLFFAAGFAVAFAARDLIVEQRTSANQLRAALAFEAAEAGIDWAASMLDDSRPVGDDCTASDAAGALAFRERMLSYDPATARQLPRTDGGAALQPACVQSAAGWSCRCASGAALPAPDDGEAVPAFSVRLDALPQPGLVRLTATGCSNLGAPCDAAAATRADATARVQLTLALVGALRSRPAAALTAGGDIVAGGAVGLDNTDAVAGGWAAHAGGRVEAPAARIATVPGASQLLAVAADDAALRALGADRLFHRHFGLAKREWRGRRGVRSAACDGDCSAALAQAAASARLIWIEGDARLESAATFGTPERPLVIAATGEVTLGGAATLHGVLYARRIVAEPAAAALVRGAVIAEQNYAGAGAPDFVYDPAVLARLQHDVGSFVRVPGSWRDF